MKKAFIVNMCCDCDYPKAAIEVSTCSAIKHYEENGNDFFRTRENALFLRAHTIFKDRPAHAWEAVVFGQDMPIDYSYAYNLIADDSDLFCDEITIASIIEDNDLPLVDEAGKRLLDENGRQIL